MRLDTTLVDFNDRAWERGDISFIFASDPDRSKDQLLILDHEAKVFSNTEEFFRETYRSYFYLIFLRLQ